MDYDNIPDELRDHSNWVGWRFEKRGFNTTKVPYQIKQPEKKASSTNSDTWCSYDEAVAEADQFDGIGFVFTEEVGIVGVDIDKCIDDDGVIEPYALHWIEEANSYTEFSPSGKGFHIYIKGNLDVCLKRTVGEIYNKGRFFTITGKEFNSIDVVRENQAAIDMISQKIAEKPLSDIEPPKPIALPPTTNEAHELIIQFCEESQSYELWNKLKDLPSQNEYDLAIATRAYIRGFSVYQTQMLIYEHRCKWNENPDKGLRKDYIEATLEKASNVDDEVVQQTLTPNSKFWVDAYDLTHNPVKLTWLIKNYLPTEGIAWLAGEWSSYKTFLMLDMAYHVAIGRDWCGNKVRQGKVLVINGEGAGGLAKRLKGLELRYGVELGENLLQVSINAVMINERREMDQLMVDILALDYEIDFIIVDTKSANMAGSDSDAATMNNWINALRKLQITMNCMAAVVDHVGHDNKERMRGSSQQAGAADVAYLLKRPDAESDMVTLSVYKDPKDFKQPPELSFMPEVIELPPSWNDEDGDPVSTLTLRNCATAPTVERRTLSVESKGLGGNQLKLINYIRTRHMEIKIRLNEASSDIPATLERLELREWAKDHGISRQSFPQVMTKLEERGLIISIANSPHIRYMGE